MKSLLLLGVVGCLAIGCEGKEAPQPYGKPVTTDNKPVARAQVKDPVCEMMVDSDKAKDHTYKDVKYYFCSQKCHDAFEKNPDAYTRTAK